MTKGPLSTRLKTGYCLELVSQGELICTNRAGRVWKTHPWPLYPHQGSDWLSLNQSFLESCSLISKAHCFSRWPLVLG